MTGVPIENRVSTLLGARRESISDLARGAGISYPAAQALYHGATKMISLDLLEKVCKYLDCQPGDILVYVPEK